MTSDDREIEVTNYDTFVKLFTDLNFISLSSNDGLSGTYVRIID